MDAAEFVEFVQLAAMARQAPRMRAGHAMPGDATRASSWKSHLDGVQVLVLAQRTGLGIRGHGA